MTGWLLKIDDTALLGFSCYKRLRSRFQWFVAVTDLGRRGISMEVEMSVSISFALTDEYTNQTPMISRFLLGNA